MLLVDRRSHRGRLTWMDELPTLTSLRHSSPITDATSMDQASSTTVSTAEGAALTAAGAALNPPTGQSLKMILTALVRHRHTTALDALSAKELASCFEMVILADGAQIYEQGQAFDLAAWVVESGTVSRYRMVPGNPHKYQLCDTLGKGGMLSMTSALMGRPER